MTTPTRKQAEMPKPSDALACTCGEIKGLYLDAPCERHGRPSRAEVVDMIAEAKSSVAHDLSNDVGQVGKDPEAVANCCGHGLCVPLAAIRERLDRLSHRLEHGSCGPAHILADRAGVKFGGPLVGDGVEPLDGGDLRHGDVIDDAGDVFTAGHVQPPVPEFQDATATARELSAELTDALREATTLIRRDLDALPAHIGKEIARELNGAAGASRKR